MAYRVPSSDEDEVPSDVKSKRPVPTETNLGHDLINDRPGLAWPGSTVVDKNFGGSPGCLSTTLFPSPGRPGRAKIGPVPSGIQSQPLRPRDRACVFRFERLAWWAASATVRSKSSDHTAGCANHGSQHRREEK
jgi:hypothetical protein